MSITQRVLCDTGIFTGARGEFRLRVKKEGKKRKEKGEGEKKEREEGAETEGIMALQFCHFTYDSLLGGKNRFAKEDRRRGKREKSWIKKVKTVCLEALQPDSHSDTTPTSTPTHSKKKPTKK